VEPVSIVIVDDHPAIVDGVRAWCAAADPPITVVAWGHEPAVAVSGAGAAADVVLFDLQLETGVPAFDAVSRLVAGAGAWSCTPRRPTTRRCCAASKRACRPT
jgi:DNA-binding NarL/FixJ family response regulator